MSLKGVAADTLRILDAGQYPSKTGALVVFRTELQAAIRGTRLYDPEQGRVLLARDVATTAASCFSSVLVGWGESSKPNMQR